MSGGAVEMSGRVAIKVLACGRMTSCTEVKAEWLAGAAMRVG